MPEQAGGEWPDGLNKAWSSSRNAPDTSPAFIVMKAADEFKDKTTAPNQLWQTDFTYLKVTGWGWFYLSTVLDDFSRYIVAWKLCTTMKAEDVTSTLELALPAPGLDQVNVAALSSTSVQTQRVLARSNADEKR